MNVAEAIFLFFCFFVVLSQLRRSKPRVLVFFPLLHLCLPVVNRCKPGEVRRPRHRRCFRLTEERERERERKRESAAFGITWIPSMALVALIGDPTTLLWPYWMWKELIWSRRLTKVHVGVASELYLNVLTNQNNFVWWYQTSLCVFKKKKERERSSKVDNQLFLGIFLYQRVWLYFFRRHLKRYNSPKVLAILATLSE